MRKFAIAFQHACLLLALLFGYLFYTLYWQWRHLFDANGRYFYVEDAVVYQQNAVFWLIPTLLFALLAGLAYRKNKYLTTKTP